MKCKNCGGKGYLEIQVPGMIRRVECPACKGTGEIKEKEKEKKKRGRKKEKAIII